MNNNYDLAILHRGSLNEGWAVSAIHAYARYPWHRLYIGSGKRLVFDKNLVTKRWLEAGETDWLLWSDEGVAFPDDAIEKLVTFTDQPSVVSALWWHLAEDQRTIYPGVFVREGNGRLYVDYKWKPPPIPTKVFGTGGGFIAIHRVVAQAILDATDPRDIDYPFFLTTSSNGGAVGYSETFALRVREAGFPYWLLPDVRITHFETIGLTGGLL